MKNAIFLLVLLGFFQADAQTDTIQTPDGQLIITPILHATMVLQWNGRTIYMDPYGGAEKFEAFPSADLVLITHVHGDHLDKGTLRGLSLENTELVAPQSVVDELEEIEFQKITILNNGDKVERLDIQIEAVPMYNLPETDESRHPKGKGNGYVLTIDGQRIYVSGDTEDIPEMRQLKDIDIAFVCMNLPYTMDAEQAASAVLDFKPKVIYPFHYRGKDGFIDIGQFKKMVEQANPEMDIEVRLRDWYPEQKAD